MEHTNFKWFAILFPLFAFFSPISSILILMIFLVCADTISGLWKSKKLGIKITSFGLSALVNKIILYCGGILLFFGIDKLILNEVIITLFSVPFITTKAVALVFCSIEIISLNENFKQVKGYGFIEKTKDLISVVKKVKKEVEEIKEK